MIEQNDKLPQDATEVDLRQKYALGNLLKIHAKNAFNGLLNLPWRLLKWIKSNHHRGDYVAQLGGILSVVGLFLLPNLSLSALALKFTAGRLTIGALTMSRTAMTVAAHFAGWSMGRAFASRRRWPLSSWRRALFTQLLMYGTYFRFASGPMISFFRNMLSIGESKIILRAAGQELIAKEWAARALFTVGAVSGTNAVANAATDFKAGIDFAKVHAKNQYRKRKVALR